MAARFPKETKPKSGTVTRSATNHWFFGQYLSDVPSNCLPLKIELVRLYLFKCHEKGKSKLFESDKNEVFTEISKRIIQIWTAASLPVKTEKAIFSQIKREIKDIMRVVGKESPVSVSQKWKDDTIQKYKLNMLFDICACTCFVNVPKSDIKLDSCNCDFADKIPEEELDFYIDQKFDRGYHISSYKDKKTQQKYDQQQADYVRKMQRKEPQRIQNQIARESSNFASIDLLLVISQLNI